MKILLMALLLTSCSKIGLNIGKSYINYLEVKTEVGSFVAKENF